MVSIKYNTYFHDDVKKALLFKNDYEDYMEYVIEYLESISPTGSWFFNGSSLCVDVKYDYINEYVSFLDSFVGCRYTGVDNLNGVTFIVSLSTLNECLEKLKRELSE